MSWEMVDEGWGRRAADFAAMTEPAACREYVAVHHRVGVDTGDRLLDIACGSGLAIELAALRGAACAGIDASERLITIARDRVPDADVRVGDMNALPWSDESFDIATSFRGIWGTTPQAVREAHRVLAPGGRFAMTIWGNVGKSPGAWMFAPFRWATEQQVQHQADMVSLGRPGVGEAFLREHGFDVGERFTIDFVLEAADPATYARALASTGPAYEAIQSIGEDAFLERATELAKGTSGLACPYVAASSSSATSAPSAEHSSSATGPINIIARGAPLSDARLRALRPRALRSACRHRADRQVILIAQYRCGPCTVESASSLPQRGGCDIWRGQVAQTSVVSPSWAMVFHCSGSWPKISVAPQTPQWPCVRAPPR